MCVCLCVYVCVGVCFCVCVGRCVCVCACVCNCVVSYKCDRLQREIENCVNGTNFLRSISPVEITEEVRITVTKSDIIPSYIITPLYQPHRIRSLCMHRVNHSVVVHS